MLNTAKSIRILLSEGEQQAIRLAAARENLNMAQFVRKSALAAAKADLPPSAKRSKKAAK